MRNITTERDLQSNVPGVPKLNPPEKIAVSTSAGEQRLKSAPRPLM